MTDEMLAKARENRREAGLENAEFFKGRSRPYRSPKTEWDSVERWSGCSSGALEKTEHEALLKAARFEEVFVEVTQAYQPEQVAGSLGPESVEALREVPVGSAFVRIRKPAERGYN